MYIGGVSEREITPPMSFEQIIATYSIQVQALEARWYNTCYSVNFMNPSSGEAVAIGGISHSKDNQENYLNIGTPKEIRVMDEKERRKGIGSQMFFCLCALAKILSSAKNPIFVVDAKIDDIDGSNNENLLCGFLSSNGIEVEPKQHPGERGTRSEQAPYFEISEHIIKHNPNYEPWLNYWQNTGAQIPDPIF